MTICVFDCDLISFWQQTINVDLMMLQRSDKFSKNQLLNPWAFNEIEMY